MRAEITRLHQRVGGTFVYVTHDQVEAMTMGTRIALMRDGVIQQFGTPREIYTSPANTYVARFIGTPPMNLIEGRIEGEAIRIGEVLLPLPPRLLAAAQAAKTSSVLLGIRPGALDPSGRDAGGLSGSVSFVEHVGAESVIAVGLTQARPPIPRRARFPARSWSPPPATASGSRERPCRSRWICRKPCSFLPKTAVA